VGVENSTFSALNDILLASGMSNQGISQLMSAGGLSDGLAQIMSVGENINNISVMAADMKKGLATEFIEREMEMLDAIINGKAIEHHLEPSYYKALKKASKKLKE
jgi:hypothetical protein